MTMFEEWRMGSAGSGRWDVLSGSGHSKIGWYLCQEARSSRNAPTDIQSSSRVAFLLAQYSIVYDAKQGIHFKANRIMN